MITNRTVGDVYYRPSGEFTVVGPLMMLAIGAGAALALGVAYAYLVLYNPLIYINFLATLGFGFVLGLAATFGLRMGLVRAPFIALIDALLVGAVAVYVAWVFWLHAFLVRMGIPSVWAISPNEMWFYIQQVAANGAWSIRGGTPTGAALYSIWAIEAALIIGICAFTCYATASAPFCESCQKWALPFAKLRLGAPADFAKLQDQLESGNMNGLSELPQAGDDHFLEVAASECPQCRALGFLTIDDVLITLDKKKNATTRRRTLMSDLLLQGDSLKRVHELTDRLAAESVPPNVATS